VADTVAVKVNPCPDTDGLADEAIETRVEAAPTGLVMVASVTSAIPVKLVSPEYTAWMTGTTADSPTTTLQVALALTRVTDAQDAGTAGPVGATSVNATVPVGVPAAGLTAATVVVKATDWPVTAAVGEAAIVAVVAPCTTD